MYTKTNKEIYRFKVFQDIEEEKEVDVEKEIEVEKEVEVEKTRKNAEGKDEKYTEKQKKKVKEKTIVKEKRLESVKKEHIFVISQPTRRQMEEADMEYSIEMSKCVKEGILTKAMLLNKYSDTGGLMSEKDAERLNEMYKELANIQTSLTQLNMSTNPSGQEVKKKDLSDQMVVLRRAIAVAETNFSSLLNHTADTRAQNKVIAWYLLNLTKIEKDGELVPFFNGKSFEEKKEDFYTLEEEEDSLLALVYEKLSAFLSFWYFSTAASSEDFEELEKDIEEGNI